MRRSRQPTALHRALTLVLPVSVLVSGCVIRSQQVPLTPPGELVRQAADVAAVRVALTDGREYDLRGLYVRGDSLHADIRGEGVQIPDTLRVPMSEVACARIRRVDMGRTVLIYLAVIGLSLYAYGEEGY